MFLGIGFLGLGLHRGVKFIEVGFGGVGFRGIWFGGANLEDTD